MKALWVGAWLWAAAAGAEKAPRAVTTEALESWRRANEVSGLLIKVAGAPPVKGDVLAMLDGYFLTQLKSEAGETSYAFFQTPKGYWVAVAPAEKLAPTMQRLNALALALSKKPQVEQAITWLHPGAEHALTFEGEAVWRFASGQKTSSVLYRWRDDPAYLQWLNGELTDTQLTKAQGAQYALTALAEECGVPGRWFFEYPNELFFLAPNGWPHDVGDNLAMISLYLPVATLVEIQQHAEAGKMSQSRALQNALAQVIEAKELGEEPSAAQKAPWDDTSAKPKTRRADFFFDRQVFGEANQVAVDNSLSLASVFSWAWRKAHPYSKK
ncbi:MAG: hypothetical protein K1X64_05905 [Myxococcaceae bacterium]|nr:hypothetical protein [Myxococcaceae bacterium]